MEKETKRMSVAERQKDVYAMNAIQGIADYAPVRQEASVEELLRLQQQLMDLQRAEVQKEGELKAARDNTVRTEHLFHEAVLVAKDQVRAQFGASSDEYQSIGLKKKSERKTPKRKKVN